MLVRHFMTPNPITFEEGDLCVHAYEVMRSRKLRRAPVVAGAKLVGMVSDRDLYRALPWKLGTREIAATGDLDTIVGTVMARELVSVTPNDHLEEAARLMLNHKIGGLPVLQKGELVGIVTESDVFRVFVRMSEQSRGLRLTVQAPASSKDLDPVEICLDGTRSLRGLSVCSSAAGTRISTLRVSGGNVAALADELRDKGFVVLDSQSIEAD